MKMQLSLCWRLCVSATALFLFTCGEAKAQVYSPPSDGWAYTFQGDAADASDDPFMSLDGTWDHSNGSDAWDGSAIGEGVPGGVSALTDGDTNFIRVQDPGDPRSVEALGISDPSNRKVYLTHNLFSDFDNQTEPDNLPTILDDGITVYFRARVATAETGPIDDAHLGGEVSAWPEEGIGYFQHNSGKSLIAIKQTDNGGANVAFGLDYGANVNGDLFLDGDDNPTQGLILPHILPSNDLAEASDPANAGELSNEFGQVVPVDDMTAWQEFWITVEGGTTLINDFEDGTHVVNVYHGNTGSSDAMTFGITAATGTDYRDGEAESYIAIGAGATPRAGAFDIDFLSWAPGIHVPELAPVGPVGCVPLNDLAGDLDGDGSVGFPDFLALSANFGQNVGSYAEGDVDCSGDVGFPDFLALSANFGKSLGATAAVPEPSGFGLALVSLLSLMGVRRRR